MTRVAPAVPDETDLLCEFCGYTLNGLPDGANCPECGVPVVASLGQKRQSPMWEAARGGRSLLAFLHDSAMVILRPTDFFKTTTTRGDERRAEWFGRAHWAIASLLFGLAGSLHATTLFWSPDPLTRAVTGGIGVITIAVASYLSLFGITWAATRLTAWEAAYRGYRLPLGVVRRGMAYHAAHYFPVAVVAVLITGAYASMIRRRVLYHDSDMTYLYVICGAVIVCAAYLFHTYWIGMRNMMYANR